MKKLIILLMGLILCSCSNTDKVSYKSINCNDITDDMIIIDVRSEEEFISGHLDNAYNIPVDTISLESMSYFSKDTKIVVYCRSGQRSKQASLTLIDMGYTNVYDLGAMNNCS